MSRREKPDAESRPAPPAAEPAARDDADRRTKEPFGSRWSRLKRQAQAEAAAPSAPATADPPPLPPLASLTPDGDFSGFMHPKVAAAVRRTALKTLFRDPRFNVMDGLDVYIDDYSKFEPVGPEMLATLTHTVEHLLRREPAPRDEPPAGELPESVDLARGAAQGDAGGVASAEPATPETGAGAAPITAGASGDGAAGDPEPDQGAEKPRG